MSYNFQIKNSKRELLTEYENVTQKVLLHIESILRMLKTSTCAPFVTRKRSKRYSISLQVFSSITRSFSVQNTTSLLKLLQPTSDSII
jgi:hypothetical protein